MKESRDRRIIEAGSWVRRALRVVLLTLAVLGSWTSLGTTSSAAAAASAADLGSPSTVAVHSYGGAAPVAHQTSTSPRPPSLLTGPALERSPTAVENSVRSRGFGVAAESESGLVNLASEARTSHILDGEVRPNGTFGGGHRPGTGFPGKSEFPAGWSDAKIMHNISDVATDPALAWRAGAKPGDFWVNGSRDGIDIEVLIRNDEIWTGYPTNVPRNP